MIDPNPPRINGEQLDVTIKTDRPMYEPGETVNVTMQVTDLAGRPKDAELSLSAVDASVYAFGEGREPQLAAGFGASHPARRFLPKPWRSSLGSSWSPVTLEQESLQEMTVIELDSVREAMAEDLQSARKELGRVVPDIRRGYMPPTHLAGMLPVSTLPMARMRTDFRETAAWLPQLRTGADGEARASFLLPDSLTRYRLTAVGLTRQTQIGSARATIRATMPLSVQTILPRFAVAKDVLKAVGLIHNTTDEAKSVDVLWRVKGPVQPTPLTNLVCQVRRVDDQTVVTSRVPVPARGSTAVGLWLTMTGPGEVTVSFQGSAGRDADAEERTLLVKGLGRRRDIALTGQFTGEHKLVLPKGFVPESLRVSLSGKQRVDVAHSLEGLHGLIAFPHGCVEQTMSRFLPAVMLKHAARQSAIDLPDGLEKKLPEVLARGLARLYNFQHKDGGWGWWEKDASNNQMTVYVLYGLARCHLSGVEIDESVVTRGSDYLKKQLSSGALARQSGRLTHGSRSVAGRELEARAWFVLSLNGTVDRDALAGYVRDRGRDDTFSISGLCNLALACRAAGLSNEGAQLWGMCKQWEPKTVDEKALYLMGQLQFRERLKACLAMATDLAGDRKGHGWGNTRATSWAIEALAGVVPFVPPSDPSGQKDALQVWVGERLIIDDSDTAPNAPPANGTFRLVRSVALGATELAYRTQLPIMCRATGDQRYLYTVSGQGHQHLDEMEAYGESLKITRRYQTLQGVPVNGPLAVGQVVECHVTVTVTGTAHDYVMLEDRRPAGCEYADDRLAGDLAAKAANTEFRDDRLVVFFTRLAPGTYSLVYYLRAETPGTSHVLPGAIYPMYAADQRGETASDTIRISE